MLELLFIVGLTLAAKAAFEHVRDDFRKSAATSAKAAEKKAAPGKLTKSRQAATAANHARGYAASEVLHAFPVTRQGWHRGWLAHKAAADQARAAREQARTDHLETRASFLKGIPEHRKRQAEALRQIEGYLTTEPNAQGKKAVRKAADAVVLPFPDRPAPPLPAEVGKPEPGPYAPKPEQAACGIGACQNDALPGESLCGDCKAAIYAKPTRRPDGQPETEADKRFFDEREAGYDGPLNGDGRRPDMDNPQEAEAVATLDRMRQRAENEPGADAATWSPQTAPQAAPSPASNGNGASPMAHQTAEYTYDQTIDEAKKIADAAEQEAARLRDQRISNMVEHLAGVLNDPGSLSSLSEIDEALKRQQQAAEDVHDRATAFRDQHQRDHGNINEAVQGAPVPAAETAYYEG